MSERLARQEKIIRQVEEMGGILMSERLARQEKIIRQVEEQDAEMRAKVVQRATRVSNSAKVLANVVAQEDVPVQWEVVASWIADLQCSLNRLRCLAKAEASNKPSTEVEVKT